MGIMKSLCSVAASTEVVSLLRHHRAKAYESFLIETPTEGGMFSPKKGIVKWIKNLKILLIDSEYNPVTV